MNAHAPSGTVVFHGYQPSTGVTVITVETHLGALLGLLPTFGAPGTTGFTWGHGGSGAAHTARCLLLAAVDDPYCTACYGTGHTVRDATGPRPVDPNIDPGRGRRVQPCDRCWEHDGYRPLPYQQFKWDYVADWKREWWMPRGHIRDWLDAHGWLTP